MLRKIVSATILALGLSAAHVHAQVIVNDPINIAKAAAIVAQVKQQVQILRGVITETRQIRETVSQQLRTAREDLEAFKRSVQSFDPRDPNWRAVLNWETADAILREIQRRAYGPAGQPPISVDLYEDAVEMIEAYYRGDISEEAFQRVRDEMFRAFEESYRATLRAARAHLESGVEAGEQIEQLDALLRQGDNPQKQRQVQSAALSLISREAVLTRDLVARQTELMAIERLEQQLQQRKQRAAINTLILGSGAADGQ